MRFQAVTQVPHKENLEMSCSSKSYVLTPWHSEEKNEVAKEHCFFCGDKEGNRDIFSTFQLDTKARQCARILKTIFFLENSLQVTRWHRMEGIMRSV